MIQYPAGLKDVAILDGLFVRSVYKCRMDVLLVLLRLGWRDS